eukprot:174125_1
MMQQGVTFFYRLFEFFDSEQIATKDDLNDDLKYNSNNNTGSRPTPITSFGDSFGSESKEERENEEDESGGITLFEDFSPNCAVAGAGMICFGDNHGWIKFINRDFQVFKFQSHSERIHSLFKTPNSDILIALGKHVDIPNGPVETFVHIWKLSDIDELGNPKKIKSFRLFTDKDMHEFPISALTATSSGSQIAVGCANGVVLVFNVNLKHRLLLEKIRPHKLTRDGPHAVTGLHYLEKGDAVLLYVITVHAIMSFHMSDRNFACVFLDRSGGCDLNCSTINDVDELIVAKSETVHLFLGEEIRGEHCFPGHKQMVCCFRRYLIVVTDVVREKKKKEEATKRVEVCIYDNANKYVAFQRQFDDLISIISEWGSVFILTRTALIKLRDKDLQEKLNEFFANNLYEKAIQLARSEGCHSVKIIEYYCKYGDYLYEKGDYNQAMEQYLQTIDVHSTIEPSYVIRRFLDAQKIKNLTEYLARLHKYGTPTKDHTTLLLNCYTKLKDSHKLNEFINMDEDDEDSQHHEVKKDPDDGIKYQFDVLTAIRVCREAGLLRHARSLAKQNGQHETYLDILLEEANQSQKNLRKYQDALKYIAALPFLDAQESIRRIGKTLIENEPRGTTQLIKDLCSGGDNECRANPEHFIHLFVRQPSELKDFLEYLIENEATHCSTAIYNTLLEIYMREAFHLRSKKRMEEYATVEQSIARVLRTESKYDATHALALGKMYGIESAVIYLYELLHLYHEIISHYRDKREHMKIIETCSRFCTQDASLWITAFTYFVKSPANCNCDEEIRLCLQQISKLNLIPPLMVTELLTNSDVHLSVIRDYIMNDLTLQNQEIESDEQTIAELEEQIEEMKKSIRDLTTQPKTFQATKCSACLAPLELPTIHFLCGHSLHERCLYNKSNPKCPKCSAKHKQTFDKQEMMQRSKGDHDSFFGQLKAAHQTGDAFNTVAEYFGRGVIY